jgi:hypothetical protein
MLAERSLGLYQRFDCLVHHGKDLGSYEPQKIVKYAIRMHVELYTVIGDVYIYIGLFVCVGVKPNKIQFYTLHTICVSKIVELK